MNEKRNAMFTFGILFAIILVFAAVDFLNKDLTFLKSENRTPAARPDFSVEELFYGDYIGEYETYAADQFVSRDKWMEIRTRLDIWLQKKAVNGVYLGKDDYLIQVHNPADYSESQEKSRIASLKKVVNKWDALVMLVPSADNILTDKLPAYSTYYDEKNFLNRVQEAIGEEHYVDVYASLAEHAGEKIYYRTDPHWTSLGARYGLKAWEETVHRRYPYLEDNLVTVSKNFRGALYGRVDLNPAKDHISYYGETKRYPVTVTYDGDTVTDSLYEEHYLETGDQYSFFLDGDHGLVEIDTGWKNGKTLFVIKDSYANAMLPLMVNYYEKIYAVDLDHYSGKLFDLMEACEPEEGMDVLVLYNCEHFLESFKYY